jgi:hypothetical protein
MAKTAWFFCAKCGFKNHPRPNAQPTFKQAADGRYDLVPGETLCEQCGASNVDGTDYTPGG